LIEVFKPSDNPLEEENAKQKIEILAKAYVLKKAGIEIQELKSEISFMKAYYKIPMRRWDKRLKREAEKFIKAEEQKKQDDFEQGLFGGFNTTKG